uniref:Uncharacterized protein n=1 Tax=Cannabis sativa TaxID=3483 RepID=A0A803P4P6_CANSA
MDDDVLLSRIARNLEKRQRALFQRFTRKGIIDDATLLNKPRGQSFLRPTHLSLTSRGKGKMVANDSDDSSPKDDDMASRLRGLVRRLSNKTSGHHRAKPMIVDHPLRRTQPSSKGAQRPNRWVDSSIEQKAMEVACRHMGRVLPIVSYELQKLSDKEEERLSSNGLLELALKTIRNEYVGLSLEIIYEIKLCNTKVDLSYMGASFL